MADLKLIKIWKFVEAQLRISDGYLENLPTTPISPDHPLHQYQDFIHHNELELAMYELEGLALESGAKPEFWLCMGTATSAMKLESKSREYVGRFHKMSGSDKIS